MPLLPGLGGLGGASQLSIVLSLKDKASAKLKGFKKNFKSSTIAMAKMGAMVGVAVAAGIGAKAVKSAADFEKAMTNVATLVDTNVENMEEMGRAVKELSKKMPVDIGDLTAALYQTRSAGIDASKAMEVLEDSAKLAVAGLGTTEEATNLLTSAFNVFEKQGYKSDEIANILFKTVKAGKTTVSELAQSFGMVAPIAGEMNVNFAELQAATAALTTTGMKASIAQTGLRAAMIALLRPTTEMSGIFMEIGVKSGRELLETTGGLIPAFEKIRDVVGENDERLAKAVGSVEALNSILFLTSVEGGQAFLDVMTDMRASTDSLTEAFLKQGNTMAAQHQILKNKLNIALIDLGNKIIPALVVMVEKLTWWFKAVDDWTKFWAEDLAALASKFGVLYLKIEKAVEIVRDFINAIKAIPSQWIPARIEEFETRARETISEALSRARGLIPFQRGGIVPGPIGAPIPAIVHGGERIIPAGRSVGIVINITGNTFMSEEEAAEKIGDMIIERLKTQERITI